jgi:hypothetical protein
MAGLMVGGLASISNTQKSTRSSLSSSQKSNCPELFLFDRADMLPFSVSFQEMVQFPGRAFLYVIAAPDYIISLTYASFYPLKKMVYFTSHYLFCKAYAECFA